jgi:hypothetical protein
MGRFLVNRPFGLLKNPPITCNIDPHLLHMRLERERGMRR